jgi:hypothetical protein
LLDYFPAFVFNHRAVRAFLVIVSPPLEQRKFRALKHLEHFRA